MRSTRALIEIVLLVSTVLGTGSCGKGSREPATYERLAASAVRLYEETQPLRSSSLGITSTDSLLFTFSGDEIARSIQRLRKLELQFSRLSTAPLTPRQIDEATVIIHWLRGELFAFETIETQRHNPLLYCSTAEEALWEMPVRITPPYPGELSAYRARILRVPALLASAKRNLANPAEAHVRFAIERLDTITSRMNGLETRVEKRYGTRLTREMELVRSSLLDFRQFAVDLLPASHGTLILGAENLSKLFLYDELLDTDPNVLTAEAENQIRRLLAEKAAIERRIELDKERPRRPAGRPETRRAPGPERKPGSAAPIVGTASKGTPRAPAGGAVGSATEALEARVERLKAELWQARGGATDTTSTARAHAVLVYPARVEYLAPGPKDPYLTVPAPGEPGAAASLILPFSAPACLPYLLLSAECAKETDVELSRRLLSAAPEILEPGVLLCESRDTVAAFFSSETFDDGWRYLALAERQRDVRRNNPALFAILVEEDITRLAQMIVVLRMHGGALTSEEAARYLVETIGMEKDAALREVLLASVAPSVAYPGISMVLIEEMLKNASYVHGYTGPARDLAKQMLESREIPLALIIPKTRSD